MTLTELFLASRVPLLGMITTNTRAIAVGWSASQSRLLLRYYFEYPPTDEEQDMVSDVVGEITSHYWQDIKLADCECVVTSAPLRNLDKLDGWLYMRRENPV